MSRKGHIKKRPTPPDSVFHSAAATKFINSLMLDGKKSTAERIFYGALDLAGSRLTLEPAEVFDKAMTAVKPLVEVKPRRVGGATYQVPVEVSPERGQELAIRWIINYSRSRKGIPMMERLARELTDACKGEGGSVKKREDTLLIDYLIREFAQYLL